MYRKPNVLRLAKRWDPWVWFGQFILLFLCFYNNF